jgi:hypothetical protein
MAPDGTVTTYVEAVGCPSVGQCVAIGRSANGTSVILNQHSSGTWTVEDTPIAPLNCHLGCGQMMAPLLSCVSGAKCYAVDAIKDEEWSPPENGYGIPFLLQQNAGGWTATVLPPLHTASKAEEQEGIDTEYARPEGLDCPVAGGCAVTSLGLDRTPGPLIYNQGETQWHVLPTPTVDSEPAHIGPESGLVAIPKLACVAAGECTVGGAFALRYANSAARETEPFLIADIERPWEALAPITIEREPGYYDNYGVDGLACASHGNCVAVIAKVRATYSVYRESKGEWSESAAPTPEGEWMMNYGGFWYDQVQAQCPAANACVFAADYQRFNSSDHEREPEIVIAEEADS